MPGLPDIPRNATAAEARGLLTAAGWTQVGTGDWSWTFAREGLAARVTPIDPAYLIHARACLAGPPNRWLPRMEAILPLRGDGYVTVMEQLYPAPEAEAEAFCAALGIPNDSGYDPPSAAAGFEDEADADFQALRERIAALMAQGARRFKLWGGSDIRPGNLMADADGRLKVVDPIFIRGPLIVQALVEGKADMLSDFSREQLEAFLTIPVFEPGPETQGLREKLAALYD